MVMACNKLQLETQIIDAQQKLNSENYFPESDSICTAVLSIPHRWFHSINRMSMTRCLKKKKHLCKTGKIACLTEPKLV